MDAIIPPLPQRRNRFAGLTQIVQVFLDRRSSVEPLKFVLELVPNSGNVLAEYFLEGEIRFS
jgi:hypothetical protein